ncbi:MAG: hypothetical protein HY286_05695 [Planctomycetes bacterium]|nr:hypothetical protein [Planctomycetota bacterium]
MRLAEITISTRRGAASGSKTEIPAIRFEITPEREPRLTGEIAPTDIVNKPELPEFYKKNPYWK